MKTGNDAGYSAENLGSGYFSAISESVRFGTDAFLLADFAAPKHRDFCLDLCSGNGIVALLLLRGFDPLGVVGVEITPEAHRLAEISKELSGAEKFVPINADLRGWRYDGRQFDVITCNPPYYRLGSGAAPSTEAGKLARHEESCRIEDVCGAARRNLKYGGRLCICQRPERLSDCVCAMKAAGIEPKRLRTVHRDAGSPAWLILLEGRYGGAGSVAIEKPLLVYDEAGEYSPEMKRIYRIGEER